jgi:hypothetical protein
MTIIDVAIQKNLPNTLTLIARSVKGLLLGKPSRRGRYSDT